MLSVTVYYTKHTKALISCASAVLREEVCKTDREFDETMLEAAFST